MVFFETLKKYEDEVKEAVDELFETAFKNQKYDTDILIVLIHGFYDDTHREFFEKNRLSLYTFGPAHVGYSLDTFYEFFHFYRTITVSKKKFLKALKKADTKERFEHQERLNINLELLIYLKFWESDLLLRQLYNLTNLASGKHYEWDFKVVHGRQSLIRKHIQTPLKIICPKFYALIEETYSAQIRNAVAHSKYYLLGRSLQLANSDPKNNLFNIPFDEWEVRFHKVLLTYNFIIGNIQKFEDHYQNEVKDKHFGLPLSVPKLNHLGLRKNQWVKYDDSRKRWLWSSQLDNES